MKVLVDTNALFSLFVLNDANHGQAKKTFQYLIGQRAKLFLTNLVIWETATVLSYKVSHKAALDFINRLPSLKLGQIDFNEDLEKNTWIIFKSQTKKVTSFVDCSNLAVLEKYKLDKIWSFDQFYVKEIRVTE